eukprot:TRINITY_DN6022_c0_g1_i1.p2 TRINITY_DN6022_c0_g1~~TRINITY_DN6022_c0_g1_i1.p2  ORF type:complete len:80 (-),score=5.42 TRINITY_DN6022_c0_g1_i1:105-344(-)
MERQPPTILVGNKCDLPTREVSKQQGQEHAKKMNALRYIEASALNGTNVNIAFAHLLRACLEQSYLKAPPKKRSWCTLL